MRTLKSRSEIFRAFVEWWSREEIYPASDKDRAWAQIGFESGVEWKGCLIEAERKAAFDAGFRAGVSTKTFPQDSEKENK